MNQETKDIISVNNVDLWYGPFQALKNINMNFKENDVTAMIGPSGCGKSTLLKSLNRMNDLVDSCKKDWYGFSKTKPVSDVDLRQRRLRSQSSRNTQKT